MVRSTVKVPILVSQKTTVKLFNTSSEVVKITKRIDFTKGTKIIDATMQVIGQQSYLSGAELQFTMNGVTFPGIHWHGGESGQKTVSYDVTTEVLDGVNEFAIQYMTAYGALSDQFCYVTATLIVSIEKLDPTDEGVEVGKSTETGLGSRIAQGLREAANLIIGVTVGVAALAAVGFVISKNYESKFDLD